MIYTNFINLAREISLRLNNKTRLKLQGIGAKIELTKPDYKAKESKCHYI